MSEFAQKFRFAALSWPRATLVLVLALTVGRIIVLMISGLELYQDETQYWIWSRTFDWGYFSKPPMIAWLIALSTGVFGDSEWAVRLPAPLLHAGTALFLAAGARHLWDERAGFFTAAAYITLPSVWVSSGVMSTDALLLCAWSGGLLAFLRLRDDGGWATALGMGAAIGLGFMSKYAMIYFVLALGLSVIIDARARSALVSLRGAAAAAVAAALVAPNIIWNAANDFATVSHTAANANWGGSLFHPEEMFQFLGDQLAVFGPVFFPVLLIVAGLAARQWKQRSSEERLLLLFALPPILIVSAQAFISRAHANWAAAAYIAATLLVVSFLLRGEAWRRYLLIGSIALHSTFGVFMGIAVSHPAIVEAVGLTNATKRIRAWDETADAITAAGMERAYSVVVFDDRNIFHQMQRYAPDLDRPLAMWLRFSGPVNHAENVWPLEDGHADWVLIVSHKPLEVVRMRADFATFESAGAISIPLDGEKTREFTLWRARGYERVTRDEAYEIQAREDDQAAR